MNIPFFRGVEFGITQKTVVERVHCWLINLIVIKAKIMVAILHSTKRNVERGWEEKDLGFLQYHAVIWLVLG